MIESFSMHIFNQVFILSKGNEILLNLHELHDDTNNIHEQKYFLTKQSYDFSKKRKQVCSIYVVTFESNYQLGQLYWINKAT